MKIHTKLLGCSAFVIQAVFATEVENEGAVDCEPCCVPEPRKCIDCVCYTAPYYDLQCDWGLSVDGEFLYWYAKENNLLLAIEYTTIDSGIALSSPGATDFRFISCPSSTVTFDGDWDPGVRVGLSLNTDCDGWDYSFTWTWYKNTSRKSDKVDSWVGEVPPIGSKMLVNPLAPIYGVDNLVGFQSTKGIWEFLYNDLDLVVGRKYYLSRCFTVRPYLGLRGTWTDTNLSTTFSRDTSQVNAAATPQFLNDCLEQSFEGAFWGVGIVSGIQPAFFFTPCFSVFGELGGSLAWGNQEFKSRLTRFSEFGDAPDNLETRFNYTCEEDKNRPPAMLFQFDLSIGLRWEDTYCCDRFSFGLDVGWEHHLLPELNTRVVTEVAVGVFTDVDPDEIRGALNAHPNLYLGSIGFGGFVLRARFGF